MPDDVEDVIVTGQRVKAISPFSPMQFPTKGNIDNPDEQQNVDDGDGGGHGPPPDETVQCSFPEGRRQWPVLHFRIGRTLPRKTISPRLLILKLPPCPGDT